MSTEQKGTDEAVRAQLRARLDLGDMSWHYKFVADTKAEIVIGLDKHMAVVNSDFLCELTTKMRQAVSLLTDNEGIAWSVESFGHVGDQGCNLTFKVEPVNTTKNAFYKPIGDY